FSLRGLTDSDDVVFDAPPQAAGQGMVPFVLTEDSARKIELSLLDKQGQLLTRATYVNLSPEVASRAKALPGLADAIEKALPRFPEKARAHAQRLLPELKPIINQSAQTAADPARSSPETWDKLNRTVTDIELKLDNPACLMQTIGKLPQADFAVGLESPMAKVMIRDFLFGGWFGDGYDLFLARNEHEGFQVVVLPFEKDLRNVTVAVSELRSADGRPMAGGKVEVSLVGHVDVVDTTPYQDIEYHGWYPDPLLSFQKSCEAKAGDNVAFWIDVATAKDTPAGEYHATVTVGADDCRPVDLKLNVTVWDFVLPDGTHLRNAFTYNEPMVGRFYKDRWTREMRYKYYDFILEHRLNIDHLYRGNRPDIEVIQYGVSRGMNAFNVGGEFRNAAANNRRSKELDDYIAELKKADLFKYAYLYGFDEIKEDKFAEMRMVFGNARRMFPGLETMTTAADHSFGKRTQLRSAVDIWVPVTDWYDQDEAHQLRKEGKEMWWYICVVPYHPFANFFIEYPSIEPRLLTGTMSYKYEAGGFLYYMINLWDNNKDVVGPGPYTNWNPGSFYNEKNKKTANGDGSLFCPGPDGPLSTMRMENIRDGFEDYEYLYMLADLASAARKQADSSAARAFADKAERLLVVPDNVVRSVTEFTTNPKDLSGYRAKLAAAILEGQAFAGATAGQ
ncbi:MAG TPA: glycoside hydrolase domain-containing protein, partial [Phycisphaerae bacterium]|nr:glycoside hydrolase domain-containing protein [Phycisphaerae bacterium]